MRLDPALILCLGALSLLPVWGAPPAVILTASTDIVRASPPACDTPYPDAGCAATSPLIELAATAEGFKSQKLIYKYTVSGGEVVGEGPKVTWDLSGVLPSVNTVRLEVEDRRGGKAVASKRVDVVRCTCPLIPLPPK